MKYTVAGIIASLFFIAATQAVEIRQYQDHVVTLSVTSQLHHQFRPWEKVKPVHRSAQAVVVPGPYLLTTAYTVSDATMIRVKKHGKPSRTQATIFHLDREVNLALLSVADPKFFADLQAVSFAGEIVTEGVVNSVRWDNGQLEVAETRLGRVETGNSRTGAVSYAVLKGITDLASGGDGEPVFVDSDLLGLTVAQSKQMATILPVRILQSYIEMAASGNYKGFATLNGLFYQIQNDSTMAVWLGQKGEPRGILIRKTSYNETGDGVLEPMDLLLEIDGHPIDSHGYYAHPVYGKIHFKNTVTQGHVIGDRVPIKLLRKGKILTLEMELKGFPLKERLIPYWRSNYAPPYFVAGGLVFRELDYNYLRASGKNWRMKADTRLVTYWELDRYSQSPQKKRIIILSHVLPDAYNMGYHDLRDLAVKEVNGFDIGSMDELERAFQYPQEGFHVIEFERNYSRNRIVLDAEGFENATKKIVANYNIPLKKSFNTENSPE